MGKASLKNSGLLKRTITPGPSAQTLAAGIYNSLITVNGVSFDATKVLTGTTIAGTAGTMPNNGAPTWGPSTSNQNLAAGYYGGGTITAVGGNATSAQILSGYTASSANGINITGSMPNNGSPTVTPNPSGNSYGAGYYGSITVQPGMRYASGTANFSGSAVSIADDQGISRSCLTVTVSGLAFAPTKIYLYGGNNQGLTTVYDSSHTFGSNTDSNIYAAGFQSGGSYDAAFRTSTSPISVGGTSFTLLTTTSGYISGLCNWIALG